MASGERLDDLTDRLDGLLAKIQSRTASTLGRTAARAQELGVVTEPFAGSGKTSRPGNGSGQPVSLDLVREWIEEALPATLLSPPVLRPTLHHSSWVVSHLAASSSCAHQESHFAVSPVHFSFTPTWTERLKGGHR